MFENFPIKEEDEEEADLTLDILLSYLVQKRMLMVTTENC